MRWQMSGNESSLLPDPRVLEDIAFVETLFLYSSLFLTALSGVALLVNLFLLLSSQYLRRPIGVNLRLCVSLTASDALCAFFYILTFVVNVLIPGGHVSDCWSLLIEVCKYSTFFASVFTLLALALNHYVGIVYPLRRHAMSPRMVKGAIILAYLIPFTFFFTLFCVHPGGFQATESFAFFSPKGCNNAHIVRSPAFRWVVVLPFIVIVLLLCFLYAHILVHMGRVHKDPLLNANLKTSKRTSNRKLLVTLVLLAGSACLGWLPTMVSYLVTCDYCLLPLPLRWRASTAIFSQTIHISKLIMDAFIYASRLIEIRYAMFVFVSAIRGRIKNVLGMKSEAPALPTEFSRYMSETKEHRSTRRKNTQHLLINSPRSVLLEPPSKRASSVVVMGSGQESTSSSRKSSDRLPSTTIIPVHAKLASSQSCNKVG